MAQLPDAIAEALVWVARHREVREVCARVVGPILGKVGRARQATQRLEHLDVEEVWGVEIAIGGKTLHELWIRVATRQDLDDG